MTWWRSLVSMAVAALAVTTAGSALAQQPRSTLVRNVTLIDGTGGPSLPGASVLVTGDRIALVSATEIQAPAGATLIDGTGKFLIPGLIDTHIHLLGGRVSKAGGGTTVDRPLALQSLSGYLYSGVTTVFDSGNNADFIFGLRAEERAGTLLAPRIYATGAILTARGGYADSPFAISVADLDRDERARVEAHFDRRPDVQKLIYDHLGTYGRPLAPVFSGDVLTKLVGLANAHGIPTTVHAENEEEARAALAAGIDAFAHPVRAAVTDDFVRTLAAKRIPVSTTLAVFSHIAMIANDVEFLETPLFEAVLDPAQLEFLKVTERRRYIASGMSAEFEVMLPHIRATLAKMHRSGVILALGTDRSWGPSVHMELELLHQAGIPLADLVRIATLNAATYLHHERDLGSIERGKLADIVLLRADPTQSVAAYAEIAMVMKGGVVIDRTKLDLPINRKSKTK